LPAVDFGAQLKDCEAGLSIQRVVEAGSAQSAGLSADDQIIAIDGLRLNLGLFEKKILRAKPGDSWQIHAFRRDELYQFEVVMQVAEANTFVLKKTDRQPQARRAWLNN